MSEEVVKLFHCPFDKCSFNEKKSFKRKSLLDQHLLNCHSKKRFKCPNCQKQYAIDWQLRYHLKSSCGRDWQCLTCGKIYTQRLSLMVHCNRNAHRFPDNPNSRNLLNHESQNNKLFLVPMFLNLNLPSANGMNSNLFNILNSNLNSDPNILNSTFNNESADKVSSNNVNYGDGLKMPFLIKKNENKFRPILPKKNDHQLINSNQENSILENNLNQTLIENHFNAIESIEHQLKTSDQLSMNNNLTDGSSQTDDLCLCPSIIDRPIVITNPINHQIINNQINDKIINQMDKSVQCPEIFDLATSTKRILNKSMLKPVLKNQSTCTEINSDTFSNLKRKSVASETTINDLNRNYCFFYDQNAQSNHLNQNFSNANCNQIYCNQIGPSVTLQRYSQPNYDQQLSSSQLTYGIVNQSDNDHNDNSDSFANSVINYLKTNESINNSSSNNLATKEDPLLSTISVQTDLDYCINDPLTNGNHLSELDLGFSDIQTQTFWNFNDNTTQTEDYAFDIDNFFV